jgi:hypothetical protein
VVAGSRLHNERLTEYRYVEECGWDGIMPNELYNAPFMQAKVNIFRHRRRAATKRV